MRKVTRAAPPRGATLGRRRVGLLGGSFNPAHDGHRHVSLLALKLLRLDEVWWLVSPHNPLKPVSGMAPVAERLAAAAAAVSDRRIRVTDLEVRLESYYTCDTLRALRTRFPLTRFVWIMGADNLVQIPEWKDWTAIFAAVPVAIFNRPFYSFTALAGKAARRYARRRVAPRQAGRLAGMRPPAWVFLYTRLHPASATRIRVHAAGGRRVPRAGNAG